MRLVREWIATFPEIRLNCLHETSGDFVVWAVLRPYGTVLWRQETPPGNKAIATAWALAMLPTVGNALPPKAAWFWSFVDVRDLGKLLKKRAEQQEKPQHTPAAHSQETSQHTLPFAAH